MKKRIFTGWLMSLALLTVLTGCSGGTNQPQNTAMPDNSTQPSVEDELGRAGRSMEDGMKRAEDDMKRATDDAKTGLERMIENGKVRR